MPFGANLTGFVYSSGEPGVLTSLNHSITDTLGGDTIVATGTGLAGTTGVTYGGTACTGVIATDTTVTFVTPAKAAGTYPIIATSPAGDSNSLNLQSWDPSIPAGCTLFCEKPDYSVGGGIGTWATRVGAAPNENVVPPADVAGAPDFAPAGTFTRLIAPAMGIVWDQSLQTTCKGTTFVVSKPDAAGAQGNTSGWASPGLFADAGNGFMGMGYSNRALTSGGVPGYECFVEDATTGYKNVTVAAAVGAMHATLMRFSANTSIDAQVDGKKNDGSAGFESIALGTHVKIDFGNPCTIGIGFSNAYFFNGLMNAWVMYNVKISDDDAALLLQWAQVRHGVA